MRVVKISTGRWYLWTLLIGILLFSSAEVQAQQLFFNPSIIQLKPGESIMVAIELADVPESGVAAFQINLHYDSSILNILNPNEEFREAGIDPFVPLGGSPLCKVVRKTDTCEDPNELLTSTDRIPVVIDKIDNKKGVVVIAYATRGKEALPVGDGTIALIEVVGVREGVVTVSIEEKKFIIANNEEPPTRYKEIEIGQLSIIVGDGALVNKPPFLEVIGPQTVDEGESLEFEVYADDPDGDSLVLIATDIPEGGSFTDNGNGTGKFAWLPGSEAEGEYKVTIKVTDSGIPPETILEEVTITVNDVDLEGFPPVPAKLVSHVGGTHVVLRWQGSDASSFLVFRRLEFIKGPNEKQFIQVGQTSKQIYNEKVPNDTVYAEYYIKAENNIGQSGRSQIIRIKIKEKNNAKDVD